MPSFTDLLFSKHNNFLEGDIFRISQIKREDITEEEVSISKEKKICLVCKGKVLGHKKEIKIEGDLFRISKRPDQITEEEVSISKEKKICLVCKGKAYRFSTYLCPGCEAFYCAKCARALIELENACWVCDAPIDESKPVKPFKKEEDIEVEISEKPQKKPKAKK